MDISPLSVSIIEIDGLDSSIGSHSCKSISAVPCKDERSSNLFYLIYVNYDLTKLSFSGNHIHLLVLSSQGSSSPPFSPRVLCTHRFHLESIFFIRDLASKVSDYWLFFYFFNSWFMDFVHLLSHPPWILLIFSLFR